MEHWFLIATISSLAVIAVLIVYCFVCVVVEDMIERGIGK